MEDDPGELTRDDAHLLLHLLDMIVPFGGWGTMTPEERDVWRPYESLRQRLLEVQGMRMFDHAEEWLDKLIREERMAAFGQLFRLVLDALEEPGIKRSEIRRRMANLRDELVNTRLYRRPPPITEWTKARAKAQIEAESREPGCH